MSDKSFKDIRKQIKNVFQEAAPEILTTELFNKLNKDIKAHLDIISKNVQAKLDDLDKRSKEMQAYIVRNVALPSTNPTVPQEEPKNE